MKFDIITIFPKIFDSYLNESILKRAQNKKLIDIKIHNLRDFTKDKHRKVDDRPFGGGPGMVIQIQPLIKAIEFIKSKIKNQKSKIILFTPTGKQFDNKMARDLAEKYDNLILICGRYEGIDARVEKVIKNLKFKIENLSMGPYVLTGGEIPAMTLIDSVSRQIPGVLGKQESVEEKRHGVGMPVYTRPEIFIYPPVGGKKYKVSKVLLSGDPKKIAAWRTAKIRQQVSL
ncbi:MAG: tRNA (guanosine(37)-N1)-methyltransferase TrmD [Patescibacteria group bacterium]